MIFKNFLKKFKKTPKTCWVEVYFSTEYGRKNQHSYATYYDVHCVDVGTSGELYIHLLFPDGESREIVYASGTWDSYEVVP